MANRSVHTDQAPAALGPYSQAVELDVGDRTLLFCSGQVAIDPAVGEVVGGGVDNQVHQVMRNLASVLDAAGSGFGKVLKTTIFLTDMADFAAVNAVYAEYLEEPFPARATVEVRRLPKDVRVEIEAIAYR